MALSYFDRRVYLMTPATSFRSGTISYNGCTYTVAGVVTEVLGGGKPWEELMKEHLLDPLGMTHTEVFNTDPAPEDNYAKSYHTNRDGTKVAVPFENFNG